MLRSLEDLEAQIEKRIRQVLDQTAVTDDDVRYNAAYANGLREALHAVQALKSFMTVDISQDILEYFDTKEESYKQWEIYKSEASRITEGRIILGDLRRVLGELQARQSAKSPGE